jgi:hypothetical protein
MILIINKLINKYISEYAPVFGQNAEVPAEFLDD